jgi:hypothetical protein
MKLGRERWVKLGFQRASVAVASSPVSIEATDFDFQDRIEWSW